MYYFLKTKCSNTLRLVTSAREYRTSDKPYIPQHDKPLLKSKLQLQHKTKLDKTFNNCF